MICTVNYAANLPINSSIVIAKYYAAKCTNINGEWHGFFVDPTDLFGDGGPWPISADISCHNGRVNGVLNASQAPVYVRAAASGELQATCASGLITGVTLGKHIVHRSIVPNSMLISKNVLLLYVPYENAMIGTNFLLILKRIIKAKS